MLATKLRPFSSIAPVIKPWNDLIEVEVRGGPMHAVNYGKYECVDAMKFTRATRALRDVSRDNRRKA